MNSNKIWKGNRDLNKKSQLSPEVSAGERKHLRIDSAGKINSPSDSADQSRPEWTTVCKLWCSLDCSNLRL